MDVPLYENNSIMFEHTRKWPWTEAAGYTVLQRFFLMRLERLKLLSQVVESNTSASGEQTTSDRWRRNLIDRAIYSTFRDCAMLGLIDEARLILSGDREKTDRVGTK